MAASDDLLNSIRQVIGQVSAPGLSSMAATNDIYEMYVLSRVIAAAKKAGGSVEWLDRLEQPAAALTFRTGPGAIYSDRRQYTHALITFPSVEALEAHIGVIVQGKSGVAHECDVAVIPESEGRLCRVSRVNPRHSHLVLSAECKYYATQIPLDLARSFIGLVSDISCTYGECHFAVNTGSRTAEKLLAKQKRHWESGLIPGSNAEESITAGFTKTFRDYQTRNAP